MIYEKQQNFWEKHKTSDNDYLIFPECGCQKLYRWSDCIQGIPTAEQTLFPLADISVACSAKSGHRLWSSATTDVAGWSLAYRCCRIQVQCIQNCNLWERLSLAWPVYLICQPTASPKILAETNAAWLLKLLWLNQSAHSASNGDWHLNGTRFLASSLRNSIRLRNRRSSAAVNVGFLSTAWTCIAWPYWMSCIRNGKAGWRMPGEDITGSKTGTSWI